MSIHNRLRPATPRRHRLRKLLNPNWVTRHDCTPEERLDRHHKQVAAALKLGREGIDRIARSLFLRASHHEVLRCARDHLAEWGGQCPGPDGESYSDSDDAQIWEWCHETSKKIRVSKFKPGPERIQVTSKGPGRGMRALAIQNICDRVVHRALLEIIQPVLEPLFSPRSIGYRPNHQPLDALAFADHYVRREGRSVWLLLDLKDAFEAVPLGRLLDVVRHYLPADDLVHFLGVLLGGSKRPGLRQGAPTSPLLLNLYLHHHLDRPWQKRFPDVPLIRYADDILVLCRSLEEARDSLEAIEAIMTPTGMRFRSTGAEVVRPLTTRDSAEWMGFQIRQGKTRLQMSLTEGAWWSLAEMVEIAHEEPLAPVRVWQAIEGWVGQYGPCYRANQVGEFDARIQQIAAQGGFDEIPAVDRLNGLWRQAFGRWMKLRRKGRATTSRHE